MTKKATKGAGSRATRMNPAVLNRETRGEKKEEKRIPPLVRVMESKVTRAQLGTIPKPFTAADVREYINKHSLTAWQGLGGWHKRKAALEEMSNG